METSHLALLDFARAFIAFGANWLVQSTILIIAGMTAARLLAARGSAAQSLIYRSTLAAALLCPVVTWTLSALGVSGWSFDVPAAWNMEKSVVLVPAPPEPEAEIANDPPAPVEAEAPLRSDESRSADIFQTPVEATRTENSFETPIVSAPASETPVAETVLAETAVAVSAPVVVEAPRMVPKIVESPRAGAFGMLAIVLVVLWILVAGVSSARLAFAWRKISQLRRGAHPADAATTAICREVASQIQLAPPPVLCSPFLPSPCLAGILRPAILLTDAELTMPVRDVLIHELAHLRRRDCHWNLLRRLATSLFFFQPLLWNLSSRLEAAAEEVCDDYVVQLGGDRAEYASRLVDIAELSTAPVAAAGVGIVSIRSMLARRVSRILDTSRGLSTRVGAFLLLFILAAALVSVSVVGLVGVSPKQTQAEAEQKAEESGAAKTETTKESAEETSKQDGDAAKKQNDGDDDLVTVRGTVVDPNGKPVAGATVFVAGRVKDEVEPANETTADAEGRFEISFQKSTFHVVGSQRAPQWCRAQIAAYSPSWGLAWVVYEKLKPGEEPVLRLTHDLPVEGRVLNLEGQPVAGAEIRVVTIARSANDDVEPWLNAVAAGVYPHQATFTHLPESVWRFPKRFRQDIRTDAQGKFIVRGTGRNRLVTLMISGDGIATRNLQLLTRPMNEIIHKPMNPGQASKVTFGATFTYVAEKARLIEGIVRDAETREPIENVVLRRRFIAGESGAFSWTQSDVVTDAEGRYRLNGLPAGAGNTVLVETKGLPYFQAYLDLPNPPGDGPVQHDIELHRGVWVTGRVTDKETGNGVKTSLVYVPALDNKLAMQLPEFGRFKWMNTRGSYQTEEDGSYRALVLPGPGYLAIDGNGADYPSGQGFEQIEPAKAEKLREFGLGSTLTAVKEVHVADNGESPPCNFELAKGASVTLRAIDASGAPIKAMTIGERTTGVSWLTLDSNEFIVRGLSESETRNVLLYNEALGIGKGVRVTAADAKASPLTVTLEPFATVTARLVDQDGLPMKGKSIDFYVAGGGDYTPQLKDGATDADGRFRHAGVPAGIPFEISLFGMVYPKNIIAKSIEAKPGETIDLGEIDITKKDRPEPKRMMAAGEANDKPATEANAKQTDKNEIAAAEPDSLTFAGRVVTPDGKPAEGADVYLAYWVDEPKSQFQPSLKPLAKTDGTGAFNFTVSRKQIGQNSWRDNLPNGSIVAVKAGFGFAWGHTAAYETSGRMLEKWKKARLESRWSASLKLCQSQVGKPIALVSDDEPIRGRVVDIDGNPVIGARVAVLTVSTGLDDTFTGVSAALTKKEADSYGALMQTKSILTRPQVHAILPPVESDGDGHFSLHGIGAHRLAALRVGGPGVETVIIAARTEPGDIVTLPENRRFKSNALETYYPSRFTLALGPSVSVHGVVRDESKQPVPGATLEGRIVHTHSITHDSIQSVTDTEGRFKLEGIALGDSWIEAIPSDEMSLLKATSQVSTRANQPPPELSLELPAAAWIDVRVTDKRSGKGIRGRVNYHSMRKDTNGRERFTQNYRFLSDADGHFRILGLPGSGYVEFDVASEDAPNYPIAKQMQKPGGAMAPFSKMVGGSNAVAEVNLTDRSAPYEVKIELDSDEGAVAGHVVDPDGKPLESFYFAAQAYNLESWRRAEGVTFELKGYSDDKPMMILFAHRERNLAGSVVVSGAPPKDLKVTLQPAGKVTGRLVDNDGEPLRKVMLERLSTNYGLYDSRDKIRLSPPLPPNAPNTHNSRYDTDDDGRFEIGGLAPGVEYRIDASRIEKVNGLLQVRTFGALENVIVVKTGETLDVGDVCPTQEAKKAFAKAADETPKPKAENPDKNDSADTNVAPLTFAGKVVTPDGKPAEGADVYLVYWVHVPKSLHEPTWMPLAKTDAAGAFSFNITAEQIGLITRRNELKHGSIVAVKNGFGFAWGRAAAFEGSGKLFNELMEVWKPETELSRAFVNHYHSQKEKPLTLVADDEPLRGRVVDIDGNGVAGARLTLLNVATGYDSTLSGWRAAVKESDADFYTARLQAPLQINGPQVRSITPRAVTDADGRFTLRGVGPQRLAELLVQGPGIETVTIFARTERGEAVKLPRQRNSSLAQMHVWLPSEFTHVAGPSIPIAGVVRDPAKKPLAGVLVRSHMRFGHRVVSDLVRTMTDAEGRYRLEGMPVGANKIEAISPDDKPLLSQQKSAATRSDQSALTVDFDLPQGVWIEGRVTDKTTGKGIPGWLEYFADKKNPAWTQLSVSESERHYTDADGRFRIAGLPGQGYVAFRLVSREHYHYPRASYLRKTNGEKLRISGGMLQTEPYYVSVSLVHAIAEVNPEQGAARATLNLELDKEEGLIAGRVFDPEGKPLENFWYAAQAFSNASWRPGQGASFELSGHDDESPIAIVFAHRERNLAGSVSFAGKPPKDLKVTLQPAGKVKGRLLDSDGAPLERLTFSSWTMPIRTPADIVTTRIGLPLPERDPNSAERLFTTDDVGRFEISWLAPNVEYRIDVSDRRQNRHIGSLAKTIIVKPGETVDLGDVRLADDAVVASMAEFYKAPAALDGRLKGMPRALTIHGRFIGEDQKPAAGARVAVIARRTDHERGGDLRPDQVVLAEAVADADGKYQMFLPANVEKTHANASLIAGGNGFGMQWTRVDLAAKNIDVSLTLPAESPLFGKFVDLEGQPAAGVKARVVAVKPAQKTREDKFVDNHIMHRFAEQWPAAWPDGITSDAQGKFTIQGIPPGHEVRLVLEPHERFAKQDVTVSPLPSPESKEPAPAGEFVTVAPLAPAQWITGVVRAEDTQQPIPNARLTVSSQTMSISIPAVADGEGKYSANPFPGTAFTIVAHAPAGAPYLMRQFQDVQAEAYPKRTQFDVALPRGVLVRGHVIDEDSDAAIAGARIEYKAEKANNPRATPDLLDGWQGAQVTNDRGEFEIVVPPGAGRLIAHGPTNDFIVREFSSRELYFGKPGGKRNYAHAVERIDPAEGAENFTATLRLKRGEKLTGEIVDSDGKPIEHAVILSRQIIGPYSLTWRGVAPLEAFGGKFELPGLAPGVEYPYFFLDKKRRLGAAVNLSAGKSPRVVLAPLGEATIRLVDDAGKPVSDEEIMLYLVVTPGPGENSEAVVKGAALAGDLDAMILIDRTNHPYVPTRSDAEGRIRLRNLIPGATHRILLERDRGLIEHDFVATSGAAVNLGDLNVTKQSAKGEPKKVVAAKPVVETAGATQTIIRGRVLGPDQKPAMGAHVAVVGRSAKPWRGGDYKPDGAVLAETVANESGDYELTIDREVSKAHQYPQVIARAEGSAIAWRLLDPNMPDAQIDLVLKPEESVAVQLVDLEGQPVSGVRLDVRSVSALSETNWFPKDGISYDGVVRPKAWLPSPVSDSEGQMIVRGVPPSHGVALQMEGNERFAPQDFMLNSGLPEQRGPRDGTYRSLVKNVKPRETAVLPLAPAQWFSGTVRYADTKAPAPHARLTIWASQQEPYGSMISVAGKADENGRYRINPKPGIRFGGNAYAADGAPYLAKKIDETRWKPGDKEKQIDVELPRGVLVRGQILEKGTGKPVANASIQYEPETANNKRATEDLLTGWQGIQISDDAGRFAIAVLPGPGTLVIHGPVGEFVLRESTRNQLARGKPGGTRTYASAFERIDPAEGADAIDLKVELDRGGVIKGELVDAQGKPIPTALMTHRWNIHPTSPFWRGSPAQEFRDGTFEITGMPAEDTAVYFIDSKQRLGATAMLKVGVSDAKVVLQSCGKAAGRFVDKNGKPVPEHDITVYMVVTPGPSKMNVKAMRAGELSADEDFIANFDRANHDGFPKSGADGGFEVPALIPGCQYRVVFKRDKEFAVRDFIAKSGETIQLGDIVVDQQD